MKNIIIIFSLFFILNSCKENKFLDLGYKKIFELKDYQGAILDYNKGIKSNPNNGEAYYYRGYAKICLNKYNDAISDFNKSIELNNFDENFKSLVFLDRGTANLRLGNYSDAINDFDASIHLSPDDPTGYFSRGKAKHDLNLRREACEDWDEYIELGGSDVNDLKEINSNCN
ncbi:tetratricopeptide repeat protein [Flavobacterium acetivorans]|uniref:tetratricopeptide repeat protein n=1 Tax=Flavobacterium acetivorans TaxID=2893883 RepID=UPI001E39D426|nr:tetratricopeptide repeat protein [Flavobacterium sp. F-29]UFH36054.1 tetratricopeptide repeat protein [Flavobacterium sp. F-29]